MMNGQVKIQGLPDIHKLPPIGNRCSISTCAKFRRNRTIQHAANRPPDAYQTFLATESLEKTTTQNPWQHKVTLTRNGRNLPSITRRRITSFSVMPAPEKWQSGSRFLANSDVAENLAPLNVKMGSVPVLTYVNDYGLGCRSFSPATVTVARLMKSKPQRLRPGV